VASLATIQRSLNIPSSETFRKRIEILQQAISLKMTPHINPRLHGPVLVTTKSRNAKAYEGRIQVRVPPGCEESDRITVQITGFVNLVKLDRQIPVFDRQVNWYKSSSAITSAPADQLTSTTTVAQDRKARKVIRYLMKLFHDSSGDDLPSVEGRIFSERAKFFTPSCRTGPSFGDAVYYNEPLFSIQKISQSLTARPQSHIVLTT
jgi:hypothetical protein